MELTPLRKGEIEVGKPLSWPVYDRNKKLLLCEGFVIETQNQVEMLIAGGLFRNPKWRPTKQDYRGDRPASETDKTPAEKQVSLSALKLNIGESLQMQSLTDQNPERYYVKLIGFVEKRSVMVNTPVVDGAVLLMREGQAFVMRGFSGRDTFAFNVNILRVCNVPFPYLHLSYPPFVQSTAIRRHNRIKISLIVSVSNATHPEMADKLPGLLTDLSLTGTMLDARRPLGEAGDTLAIALRVVVGDLDAYLTLNAAIRNIRTEMSEARPEPVFHHGMEFLEMATNDKMILQNFVYTKMVEGI
ncbi:MAG: flagellar brake protein [Sulfuricella sp.]|nr:flagellar brake protein [Sulfuricella sp.]